MTARTRRSSPSPSCRGGWDALSQWYDGWVGHHGSIHHRELALPAVLDLLRLHAGERLLDVGCGQGVLAPHVAATGARYTGVDASPNMVQAARRHHGDRGRFLVGDACRLESVTQLEPASFDAVTFVLSIQDIAPLQQAIASAAWALAPSGRLVMLMTHPCFRVPRQSGWGFDDDRKLCYRRVDSYMTPMSVPLKAYRTADGRHGVTHSFHRPLQDYVLALASRGLVLDSLREVAAGSTSANGKSLSRHEQRARDEIPLFLGLRAVRSAD